MSARRLALLFCLALALLLPVLLPLRLGLRMAGLEDLGLRAAAASGSVWSGRLHDARLRGRALGDIDVRLSPLRLLAGTQRFGLTGADAGLTLERGRRHGIADAHGTFVVDRPAAAPGFAVTLRGDGVSVLFDDDGCRVAAGRLALELRRSGSEEPLAALAGDFACDGDDAIVALEPVAAVAPPFDRLRIEARIEPEGRYRLQSLLPAPGDDAAKMALETVGFQPGPAGWSRIDEGILD